MAKPRVLKKIDLRKAMRITTILVLVGGLLLVGLTALFMMNTLNAVSSTSSDLSQADIKIDTIDTAKLDAIQQRLDKKTTLDAPRQGQLQNPFVTPSPTAAPSPSTAPASPTAGSSAAPSPTGSSSGISSGTTTAAPAPSS